MGDSNINILNKDNPTYAKLQNILQENNMKILEIPPTRVTPTTATSIDCCYTNIEASTLEIKIHQNHISDHHGVSCTLKKYKHRSMTINKTFRNTSFQNLERLKEELAREDWNTLYAQQSVWTKNTTP